MAEGRSVRLSSSAQCFVHSILLKRKSDDDGKCPSSDAERPREVLRFRCKRRLKVKYGQDASSIELTIRFPSNETKHCFALIDWIHQGRMGLEFGMPLCLDGARGRRRIARVERPCFLLNSIGGRQTSKVNYILVLLRRFLRFFLGCNLYTGNMQGCHISQSNGRIFF